jgi:tetratricopeptide (TPR) repeat protein
MLKRTITLLFILFTCIAFADKAWAQPTWTLDPFGREKKPKQFEDRKLGSERTADKKFTIPRNVIQNNITHYNYYFNANNKVNAVIEKAKMSYKDDYSKLLAFYPFTLANSATQKNDLDSVIYTATAGILLHDLRNDWIDNLYLLIGKSYFYKNQLDSAEMTFEFINYNLFPRKKREDDNRVVGTNSAAKGNTISIANREKRNILQKVFSLPPSRNDALIWLSRTLIEEGEYSEAAGLINILQNDPNLPRRLRNDLEEVNSYWFYKQATFDSSAVHLEKALSNADTKEDKSRWQFLLAQLYEMNGHFDKASAYYKKAAKQTVDPLLDIYAHLNEAKMLKNGGDPKSLDRSIDNLAKMAHRDKFEAYRDIIYYSAGQLSLQKPDTNAAINFFRKSLKYNETNTGYKNKSFIQLGDIAFKRKQYRQAAALYDSLLLPDTTIMAEKMAQITERKNALSKLVDAVTIIEREDSLQKIAALPPAEREDFVKKLLRRLRKENGLKEDNSSSGGGNDNPFANTNTQQADLFASSSTGEWYFDNASRKSKGFNEFKSRWGNRANTDNWRRKSATELNTQPTQPNLADNKGNKKGDSKTNTKNNSGNTVGNTGAQELSYENMMQNLPLNPEKLAASNDLLADNLLILAGIYQNDLEEFELAAITYEDYLRRFPDRLKDGEVYLGLYYCYKKMGNNEKANYYKKLLDSKFANSKSAQLLNNPASLNPKTKDEEATKVYDQIYTLFIEGDFEKAIEEKKKADGVYGMNYWTPQLLYIEALYNVKLHNDSVAIAGLNAIIRNYPTSALKDKAANMIDVLKRRAEIEAYLTSLQVTRQTEDQLTVQDDKPAVPKQPAVIPVVKDSTKKESPNLTSGAFTLAPASPHYVLMILEKVDGMYVTESKNALDRYDRENYYGQTINIAKDVMDADRSLLVISSFADATAALQYYDKIKKDARSEISWLPANKYSFLIITEQNLQLLKANKNITGYKTLLNTLYPNRF